MKIRYRDTHGALISTAKAKSGKGVVSEIYNETTGKRIGVPVRGYYQDVKKLARDAMPKVNTRQAKTYTPSHVPNPRRSYDDDEPDYEEPDDDDLVELEEQWDDLFEEDFSELDEYFEDDLWDTILEDDSEWYH